MIRRRLRYRRFPNHPVSLHTWSSCIDTLSYLAKPECRTDCAVRVGRKNKQPCPPFRVSFFSRFPDCFYAMHSTSSSAVAGVYTASCISCGRRRSGVTPECTPCPRAHAPFLFSLALSPSPRRRMGKSRSPHLCLRLSVVVLSLWTICSAGALAGLIWWWWHRASLSGQATAADLYSRS